MAQFDRLKEAQASALNLQHWKDFMKCLMHAGYRSGKVITSDKTVLYSYVFYLLGKAEYVLPEKRDAPGNFPLVLLKPHGDATRTGLSRPSKGDLIQLRDEKDGAGFLTFINKNIVRNSRMISGG